MGPILLALFFIQNHSTKSHRLHFDFFSKNQMRNIKKTKWAHLLFGLTVELVSHGFDPTIVFGVIFYHTIVDVIAHVIKIIHGHNSLVFLLGQIVEFNPNYYFFSKSHPK